MAVAVDIDKPLAVLDRDLVEALVERATGRLIGRAGLLPWTLDGSDEVEIAYAFALMTVGLAVARPLTPAAAPTTP